MSTLSRVTAKLFGGTADPSVPGEIGQFGSALAGTKYNTADVAEIQALAAYSKGWSAAVVTDKNFPPIEEVTGVLKTLSYQNCYLLQEGIPAYDSGTEYTNTSIVKNIVGNELQFYKSQTNGNINKPLNNTTYWRKADIVGTREIGIPQITLNMNYTLPDNCIWLEGQTDKIVGGDFPNLYNIYGTDYNNGTEEEGYYRLPDFRGKAIYGGITAGYVAAALPDLGLSTTSAGAHTHTGTTSSSGANHTHTRGTMNITGYIDNIDNANKCSGAFYQSSPGAAWNITGESSSGRRRANFDASKTWTGKTETASANHTHTYTTSSAGEHTHTITSSNAIVGASDTVQVPGIKVRVYTRYE